MNRKTFLGSLLLYVALMVAAVTFIYPFIWMIAAAFSPESEIGKLNFWPSRPTWNNFTAMMGKIPIGRSLINSLLIAAITTSVVLITGSMVGYALAKMRFKGRQLIFYVIVFTMSLPFQITLIPNYILMVNFRLVDTYFALILPFAVSAFAILMLRQAFQGLPQALIDAARLDGCNELQIIFRILWPNIKPTLVTVAILTFIGSWNEVLWPLIVIRDEQLMTMPQLVTLFCSGRKGRCAVRRKNFCCSIIGLAGDDCIFIFSETFHPKHGVHWIKGLTITNSNEHQKKFHPVIRFS
jgi:multiple sugar transport system permease protein